MAKISLIIPCWHSAKHMPHLLEDLQAQTFKDFEAILVNDGDESQEMAMEEIAAKDRRIRIIRLEQNSGTAAARNIGINNCSSSWVGFADHDDRFGPHFLQRLFEAVDGKGVEMACGGFTFHYVKTGKDSFDFYGKPEDSPQFYDFEKAYQIMHSSATDREVWNKLYNIDIIRQHKICFKNVKICDDCFFNLEYFQYVKKTGMVYNCDYVWYVYDGSSQLHSYDPLFMDNARSLADLREKLRRNLGWSEERIKNERNKELTYDSFRMCSLLFTKHSPLTIRGAAKKIKEELLSQSVIVSAILEGNYDRDRMIRLHQHLVRIGNERLMAFVFKILCIGKKYFGNFYAIVKPFFRGN